MNRVLLGLLAAIVVVLLGWLILRQRTKPTIFGLSLGLVVWVILILVVLYFHLVNWADSWWHFDGVTGFAASYLAALIAKRRGLLIGLTIGSVHLAAVTGLWWAWVGPDAEFGQVVYILTFCNVFYLLPSVFGGYLGQRVARVMQRRRCPSDQKLPKEEGD